MIDRVRYRIDFNGEHHWFVPDKEKIASALDELKEFRPVLYEVTERLDTRGEVIESNERKLNIEKES